MDFALTAVRVSCFGVRLRWLIFIYGALIVPMAFVLETLLSPPLWVHAIVWGLVMLGATLLSLRVIKAVIVAKQFEFQTPET